MSPLRLHLHVQCNKHRPLISFRLKSFSFGTFPLLVCLSKSQYNIIKWEILILHARESSTFGIILGKAVTSFAAMSGAIIYIFPEHQFSIITPRYLDELLVIIMMPSILNSRISLNTLCLIKITILVLGMANCRQLYIYKLWGSILIHCAQLKAFMMSTVIRIQTFIVLCVPYQACSATRVTFLITSTYIFLFETHTDYQLGYPNFQSQCIAFL